MRTNIVLDDELVNEGFKLTQFRTKKDLVNHALAELVHRLKRKKLLKYKGKVRWEGSLQEMRKAR